MLKDAKFEFSKECLSTFDKLKEILTTAATIVAPNWNLPFELMCDANDYVVGVVLGKMTDKKT